MTTTTASDAGGSTGWRRALVSACALGLVVIGSLATWPAPGPAAAERPWRDTATLVARGQYLVNEVAMCVQCHSPRDQQGNLIEADRLRGGAIPVRSPFPGEAWALSAPSLRGLVGFTDEQALALLMTGKAPGRPAPKRPMPPYRLNRADAEAIVAYLRTR